MTWRILIFPLLIAGIAYGAGADEEKRGGLALQFDDGWSSWVTTIAPEIAAVKGVATGFVNNQYILNGRITVQDLLTLQNEYGWEIGTHTWHHNNAPRFVQQKGLSFWLSNELEPALAALRSQGVRANNLVFPFNAYTREIAQAVRSRVGSFRASEILALSPGQKEDGSVPGTAIDMAHYVPVFLLKRWIDLAHQKDQILFLYGHRVLPDSKFTTGIVSAVSSTEVTALADIQLPDGNDLVLVPDIQRRPVTSDYFHIIKTSGNKITVDKGDLSRNTSPGATFLIGEAYSTRLSDLQELLKYAERKLFFYTIQDIVDEKHLAKRADQ